MHHIWGECVTYLLLTELCKSLISYSSSSLFAVSSFVNDFKTVTSQLTRTEHHKN